MKRRQILKYAAMVTGTAICAPITLAMLSGCSKQSNITSDLARAPLPSPSYFKQTDFTLLSQIIDTILPKTDTPSATDVGVHVIIDNMFAKVYEPEYQAKFMLLFSELSRYLGNFDNHDGASRLALLKALEMLPINDRNNAYWAYIDIKQQCVAFYLSTEQIAENYLHYLPIPGQYKPCISLDEVNGKAWAI
jgi:hypothetical protein